MLSYNVRCQRQSRTAGINAAAHNISRHAGWPANCPLIDCAVRPARPTWDPKSRTALLMQAARWWRRRPCRCPLLGHRNGGAVTLQRRRHPAAEPRAHPNNRSIDRLPRLTASPGQRLAARRRAWAVSHRRIHYLLLLLRWLEYLEGAHEGLVHAHHRARVLKLAAVVGCRKDGDQLALGEKFVALLDNLRAPRAAGSSHIVCGAAKAALRGAGTRELAGGLRAPRAKKVQSPCLRGLQPCNACAVQLLKRQAASRWFAGTAEMFAGQRIGSTKRGSLQR